MAAATPALSNGKLRGKLGWQRVVRSTSSLGTGRSGSVTRPRLTMQQQLELQQQKRKEEEEKRKELEAMLQTTKTDLEEITVKYENEKSKKEEMTRNLEQLKTELATTRSQLERANRSLEVVRAESREKAQLVAGLQKEVRRLEDRKNVLEYRCMDVEKLEIAVENGKKAFEAKQIQLASSEHEVRALTRSVQEQQQAITEAETKIETMTAQMADLKIQVREEVTKNISLDERVAAIPRLEERLQAKETEAEELRRTVQEKDILHQHTRQSLREEKDRNQKLSEEVAEAMNRKEEYDLALAENMTLKKLIQAKDVLLIQKSQILANVRNVVSSGNRGDSVDELLQEALDSKGAFVATYPRSGRMQGPKKILQMTSGDHGAYTNGCESICLPGSYEECSDVKVKFRTTTSQSELRLLDDAPEVTSSVHRTQNGTPEVLLGTPEVSSGASKRTQNALKTGVTELQSDSLEIQHGASEDTRSKPTTSFFKSILRQDSGRTEVNVWGTRSASPPSSAAKTCIVRPQLYSGSSFADFRSAATSGDNDVTTVDVKSDPSRPASAPSRGSGIVKRVHSFIRTRGQRRINKVTMLAVSSPREATVRRSWSAGVDVPRCFVRTSSFLLAPQFLAPKRDRAISAVVHVGNRVMVDLGKRKDKHRNRQPGVVTYVGTLDKQHDGFCLYAGIRFDKPIGNTDGMYRGTHYFNTCSKHGRFVRIAKVVAVMGEGNVYREVKELLPEAWRSDQKLVE